jgi:hypothetical protein
MGRLNTALLLAASLAACAGQAPAPAERPAVTVSGVSAGGHMAHQLHIAYSDLFSGAGIAAAGPFGCAQGSLATAMGRCMASLEGELPVAELAAEIRAASQDGRLAPAGNLVDDRVWLFRGTLDTVVAAGVNDAVSALYEEFMPAANLRYVNDLPAAHHFPVRGAGHACDESQPPFLGDCDYDAAGELLRQLYPDLGGPGAAVAEHLVSADLPGAEAAGLGPSIYLYVPGACQDAPGACALHLVLHGCAQSRQQLGLEFIQSSGYLPWAEGNAIVLAFPQVVTSQVNPYACWDWWGYTGPDYRWRDGAQMQVLANWVRDFTGR